MMKLSLALATSLAVLAAGCDSSSEKPAAKQKPEGATAAFGTYLAKSKASEAKVNLNMIFLGARAYYMNTPQPSIEPVAPQVPGPSVGPTPAPGTCCKNRADKGKCAPDPQAWSHPVWHALMFSVDEPHYYSYEFVTDDERQSFTARAIGDLDCDGTYSTFALTGQAADEDLTKSPTLVEVNPLE